MVVCLWVFLGEKSWVGVHWGKGRFCYAYGFRDLGADIQIAYTLKYWVIAYKSQIITTEVCIQRIVFPLYFVLCLLKKKYITLTASISNGYCSPDSKYWRELSPTVSLLPILKAHTGFYVGWNLSQFIQFVCLLPWLQYAVFVCHCFISGNLGCRNGRQPDHTEIYKMTTVFSHCVTWQWHIMC